MPEDFKAAFEKNALLGKMVTGLITRGGKRLLGGARKAGSYALKNPLKAGGAALGVGFAGMEAANVKNQVSKYMKNSGGTNMTSSSFGSYKR